jgi:ubiquinone/menaquinone biosynthesis C-methylase UbiE
MREMQEQLLNGFPNFKSMEGTAEQTTLPDNSVDVIVSAQAFHWFDREKSKAEFSRILKDHGHIVLAWHSRSIKSSFQKDYEQVLYDHIEGYEKVSHRNLMSLDIEDFFSPATMKHATLDFEQSFDLEGLKGRLKSASYCPKEGLLFERLMQEMEDLFGKYQQDGRISFSYETLLYWC